LRPRALDSARGLVAGLRGPAEYVGEIALVQLRAVERDDFLAAITRASVSRSQAETIVDERLATITT